MSNNSSPQVAEAIRVFNAAYERKVAAKNAAAAAAADYADACALSIDAAIALQKVREADKTV